MMMTLARFGVLHGQKEAAVFFTVQLFTLTENAEILHSIRHNQGSTYRRVMNQITMNSFCVPQF